MSFHTHTNMPQIGLREVSSQIVRLVRDFPEQDLDGANHHRDHPRLSCERPYRILRRDRNLVKRSSLILSTRSIGDFKRRGLSFSLFLSARRASRPIRQSSSIPDITVPRALPVAYQPRPTLRERQPIAPRGSGSGEVLRSPQGHGPGFDTRIQARPAEPRARSGPPGSARARPVPR